VMQIYTFFFFLQYKKIIFLIKVFNDCKSGSLGLNYFFV